MTKRGDCARGRGAARWLALLVPLMGAPACGTDPPEPAVSEAELLRNDPRIRDLLYDCEQDGHYGRDTSDMVSILVDKLQTGQMDALRRAREELASMGEEALLAVARLMNRQFSERMSAPYLQNAVDVLAMAPPVTGATQTAVHDALMRTLDYGESSVRLRALQALARGHAQPEDYERLRDQLAVEPPTAQVSVVAAMFASDRARAEHEALEWIDAGTNAHLWANLTEVLIRSEEPDTIAEAGRLYRDGPVELRMRMAAIAARGGDPDAAEALAEAARVEDDEQRMLALQALGAAGLVEEVTARLRDDPSARVRVLAAQLLKSFPDDDAVLPALREALEDAYAEVRGVALGVLMERGSPEALERALVDLGSPNRDVARVAIEALRVPMRDASVARRVLERLLARDAQMSGQSMAARRSNFQLIGQVPLAEAARYLRQEALAHPDEQVGPLSLHRWMMIQASNTGRPGRAVLAEAYRTETDAERRIDLIWAVSAQRDELAYETFVGALQDESLSEYERLFLFERLCRSGPAAKVAPLLKASLLGFAIPEVRRAAQCLMWRWY